MRPADKSEPKVSTEARRRRRKHTTRRAATPPDAPCNVVREARVEEIRDIYRSQFSASDPYRSVPVPAAQALGRDGKQILAGSVACAPLYEPQGAAFVSHSSILLAGDIHLGFGGRILELEILRWTRRVRGKGTIIVPRALDSISKYPNCNV